MRPTAAWMFCDLQRIDDVVRHHAEAGEPVALDPDAHAVFERAEQEGIADAAHPLDIVEDVDGRVIRQEQRVVKLFGRIDGDDAQQRRGLLLDAQAAALDLVGKLRFGEADAVLHIDGVDVGIGADREADGQRIAAVIAAVRLHVEHVVDADDLRLDRLRDGRFDDCGAGAGIGRGHLHLRRHDIRKLGERDGLDRDEAGDRDDDRDDDRKPRAVDEDARNHDGFASSEASVGSTTMSGRTFWTPMVITRSPSLRPWVMMMLLP